MSSTSITADDASWLDLFRGANALRVLVLAAGVALHAINLYLTTTILPSVVDDVAAWRSMRGTRHCSSSRRSPGRRWRRR